MSKKAKRTEDVPKKVTNPATKKKSNGTSTMPTDAAALEEADADIADSAPDEQTAEQAWKALQKQIKATKEATRRIYIRPLSAVRQSINLAKQAQADRSSFEQLPQEIFMMDWIDSLEQRALAFWHTDIIWRRLSQQTPTTEYTELLDEAGTLRPALMNAAIYLWEEHKDLGPLVSDIRSGRGTEDTADDLVRLADLFTTHWKEAEGQSKITQKQVKRAATVGAKLLELLDNQPTKKEIKQAQQHRQQAWSYLDQATWEIQEAGRYLFRHENPDERYPAFKRAASSKKVATAAIEAPDTPGPAVSP